jgi:hypothetical protein
MKTAQTSQHHQPLVKYYVTVILHTAQPPYRLRINTVHIYATSPQDAANEASAGEVARPSTIGGLNGHTVHWFTTQFGRIISVEESLLS